MAPYKTASLIPFIYHFAWFVLLTQDETFSAVEMGNHGSCCLYYVAYFRTPEDALTTSNNTTTHEAIIASLYLHTCRIAAVKQQKPLTKNEATKSPL